MSSTTQQNNQDLFKILVAIAWIDGTIQPEERQFLENIAAEQNIILSSEVEAMLTTRQETSTQQCYQLLQDYLGSHPEPQDYQNLLSAVSSLIYSDNDIATEEAELLTQIQNLNPHHPTSDSALNKLIAKIQKVYQRGLQKTSGVK